MHKNTCPLSNQTGGWGASLPPECNCGWNIRQDTGAPEKEGWRCNFCIKHTSCVGLNADGKPVITCPHECHQTKEEGEYNYACSCGTKRWKQGKNKSLGRGDGKDSCADCQKWLNGSPKEAGWEEAKKYFEANLLDGDDIKACGGAMIDAEECWEVVKDLLETTREECKEGKYDIPMGVSQWKNHGEKYGYDKFFEKKEETARDDFAEWVVKEERERIKEGAKKLSRTIINTTEGKTLVNLLDVLSLIGE